MSTVYRTKVGHSHMRSVRVKGETFVSLEDLHAELLDLLKPYAKDPSVKSVLKGLDLLKNSQRKTKAFLGSNENDPVIASRGVDHVVKFLGRSIADSVEHYELALRTDELRQPHAPISVFLDEFFTSNKFKNGDFLKPYSLRSVNWYVPAMPVVKVEVTSGFISDEIAHWHIQPMAEGKPFSTVTIGNTPPYEQSHDRVNTALVVRVTHGDDMYTAECDALHLVTEAENFEALTERVWELVPEMIDANGLDISEESLSLKFEYAETFSNHRVAL